MRFNFSHQTSRGRKASNSCWPAYIASRVVDVAYTDHPSCTSAEGDCMWLVPLHRKTYRFNNWKPFTEVLANTVLVSMTPPKQATEASALMSFYQVASRSTALRCLLETEPFNDRIATPRIKTLRSIIRKITKEFEETLPPSLHLPRRRLSPPNRSIFPTDALPLGQPAHFLKPALFDLQGDVGGDLAGGLIQSFLNRGQGKLYERLVMDDVFGSFVTLKAYCNNCHALRVCLLTFLVNLSVVTDIPDTTLGKLMSKWGPEVTPEDTRHAECEECRSPKSLNYSTHEWRIARPAPYLIIGISRETRGDGKVWLDENLDLQNVIALPHYKCEWDTGYQLVGVIEREPEGGQKGRYMSKCLETGEDWLQILNVSLKPEPTDDVEDLTRLVTAEVSADDFIARISRPKYCTFDSNMPAIAIYRSNNGLAQVSVSCSIDDSDRIDFRKRTLHSKHQQRMLRNKYRKMWDRMQLWRFPPVADAADGQGENKDDAADGQGENKDDFLSE